MRETYFSELKTRLRDAALKQHSEDASTISLYSEALYQIDTLGQRVETLEAALIKIADRFPVGHQVRLDAIAAMGGL